MVDLKGQYNKIKDQIDTAVIQTIESTSFINGPIVKEFANSLPIYTEIENSSQDFIIQKVKEFFNKIYNGFIKLFRT